ncbi:MAG: DUF2785 domain-containing protein [Nocardioides sp.]|nr:DUF2785 domain-containing protein [Nocardioides sp.]
MASTFWEQVRATGLEVPTDRPLDELTTELTIMLGSSDPGRRDDTAYHVLATWISRGVYDDLLGGLGDGMTAGLTVGLGESGSDSVFRRSFSALILAECLDRNNVVDVLPRDTVLVWGDHLSSWFVREKDLRGHVADKGWAHAVAHGADAVGVLGQVHDFGAPELTVLLDVIADRVLAPTDQRLLHGEADRVAAATLAILRRDIVPLNVLEPWLARIGAAAGAHEDQVPAFNTQAFLRALHLQLAIGRRHPAVRADLLLTLVDHLRSSNPDYLGQLASPNVTS